MQPLHFSMGPVPPALSRAKHAQTMSPRFQGHAARVVEQASTTASKRLGDVSHWPAEILPLHLQRTYYMPDGHLDHINLLADPSTPADVSEATEAAVLKKIRTFWEEGVNHQLALTTLIKLRDSMRHQAAQTEAYAPYAEGLEPFIGELLDIVEAFPEPHRYKYESLIQSFPQTYRGPQFSPESEKRYLAAMLRNNYTDSREESFTMAVARSSEDNLQLVMDEASHFHKFPYDDMQLELLALAQPNDIRRGLYPEKEANRVEQAIVQDIKNIHVTKRGHAALEYLLEMRRRGLLSKPLVNMLIDIAFKNPKTKINDTTPAAISPQLMKSDFKPIPFAEYVDHPFGDYIIESFFIGGLVNRTTNLELLAFLYQHYKNLATQRPEEGTLEAETHKRHLGRNDPMGLASQQKSILDRVRALVIDVPAHLNYGSFHAFPIISERLEQIQEHVRSQAREAWQVFGALDGEVPYDFSRFLIKHMIPEGQWVFKKAEAKAEA